MKKIQIINGPNLNLLGRREPGVYGARSFDDYLADLRRRYPDVRIEYFQSNVEGELINCIHEVGFDCDGIILNAGAYTHTSIALQDAIPCVDDCLCLPRCDLWLRPGLLPPGPGGVARLGLMGYACARGQRYLRPWTEVRPPVDGDTAG